MTYHKDKKGNALPYLDSVIVDIVGSSEIAWNGFKEGKYDFESLYALDLELFNQHLLDLLKGKEVELPEFSFADGRPYFNGSKMKMDRKDVLVIEGIHALNPELTKAIDPELKFGVYVSALTTISIDDHFAKTIIFTHI